MARGTWGTVSAARKGSAMRRSLILGFGLAGMLSGSAAFGQFAADRTPAPTSNPAPFGGAQPTPAPMSGQPARSPSAPAAPTTTPRGNYVPPVGGLQPATGAPIPGGFQPAGAAPATPPPEVEIPSALGPNHPLAVKPEHGAYFICVKSYSRPNRPDPNDPGVSARELAEGLAKEIRETHNVNVLLFEYISEEKKAEAMARAAAIERARAFSQAIESLRKKSQLKGMEFLEPDNKIYYKTFNYRDQIAVLIGGFRTEDDAVKALAVIKKWPSPKDVRLLDGGAIARPGDNGKRVIEKTFLNPFPQAMVVPNPAIPREEEANANPYKTDPFLVKLNEGRPYNLLKATRTWTLGVKSFSAPVQVQSADEDSSLMRRIGFGKGADILNAGAEQAEALAKSLRDMKGPPPENAPLNLEAFVLHTRTGSIVTVGQFDSPNDPALLETRRLLMSLQFDAYKDPAKTQYIGKEKLFRDNIIPVPIPKP